MKLRDINFGKIDAYNEYLTSGAENFKNSFYCHPSLQLDRIINGDIYYICGNKGTGKTMLLKYVELKVLEEPNCFVHFIRFKKDVDDNDRNAIKRVSIPSNGFESIVESDIPADDSINCVLAWKVYLIKAIISLVAETEYGVFKRDSKEWDKLVKLIRLVYNNEALATNKILPKVRRGKVEVDLAKVLKLGVELEWDERDKTGVPFNILAKKIVELYTQLQPNDGKLFVLIDELELSLNKNKDYERDISLIRDLVFAIQYLSEDSRTQGFSIYFIAAIRNEVYKNLLSVGMEINKPIADFGIQITWQQKGGSVNEHPLIKMLEQRINNAEQSDQRINIWEKYFSPMIGKTPIKNYILDQTWLKPRDIIRLFSVIQKHFPDAEYIDQACFDAIRQEYSGECWFELAEELRVKYTNKEVEGIKQSLIGLTLPFYKDEFVIHLNAKKELYEEVEVLNRKKNISYILKDLYEIGIIGNYRPGRFYFMGDYDFDPSLMLTVHYPLQKFFKNSMKAYV